MNSVRPDDVKWTLQRFIDWAREQGWLYAMEPGHLRYLERFLQARGIQRLDEVDSVLLAEHQRCLATHKSRLTVNEHLSTWRSLWRYLLKEQLVERDATQGLRAFPPDYYVPHLHSAEDLRRIERAAWEAIGQAKDRRQRFVRQTLYAAFCLLRDAGLRSGEVRRLDANHYDPRTRVLHLEGTKFLKTRDIPLPRSTGSILEKYLQHRQSVVGTRGKSAAFFVSPRGYRLRAEFFQSHFQPLLRDLAPVAVPPPAGTHGFR
jgi:site-specific recombinase XerD